ncbi:MAG: ABC transporter permease [Armatimonadetes bacterium]|nr:ABC transporter permease [Armatimonadota bacterium]
MRRDRLTLAMMLMLPLVQLAVFGYAINTDVKHVPMAVLDYSQSRASRELVQAFTNSDYFDIRSYARDAAEITRSLDAGRVKVGLIIHPDYARDLERGLPARAQVLVDASDPITASSTLGNSSGIANALSLPILFRNLRPGTSYAPGEMPVTLEVRGWYNPDLVTANYIVPGLIGTILAMTMMMITAMAIVKERETGTLEQLITTPIRGWELMIGKIVPYVGVGFVQITIALLVGMYVFRVPVRGNLVLLYVLSLLYIGAYLGIGLVISTIARTQQQALQMSFFIFLPTILLSGFMFPIAGMPVPIQVVTRIIPLTYFLEILRGIILKGVGVEYLWHRIGPLAVLTTVILGVAIARFRKQV